MDIVLFDCDNILKDFNSPFIKYINQKYKTSYSVNDLKSYEYEDNLDIPKDEINKSFNEFLNSDEISTLPYFPNADVFFDVINDKYDTYIITSIPFKQTIVDKRLFNLSDLGIDRNKIIFTNDKKSYYQYLKRVYNKPIKYIFEDCPKYIEDYLSVITDETTIFIPDISSTQILKTKYINNNKIKFYKSFKELL